MKEYTKLPFKRAGSAVAALLLVAGAAAYAASTRLPLKAGTWYSSDPQRLGNFVSSSLDKSSGPLIRTDHTGMLTTQNPEPSQEILALVEPHANFRFSGAAAAHGYRLLQGHKFNRVFILGPLHFGPYVPYAALPGVDSFATPLGDVPVDTEVVRKLQQSKWFKVDESVQDREHSIEMQLPFLIKALGPIKIVPIVTSNNLKTYGDVQSMADDLRKVVAPGDLLVVSTDLTHFGNVYGWAPFRDHIRQHILEIDRQSYSHIQKLDPDGLRQCKIDTGARICGMAPLLILLKILPAGTNVSLLDYYTSEDVLGEAKIEGTKQPWSVSYLTIAFSGKTWADPPAKQARSAAAAGSNAAKPKSGH